MLVIIYIISAIFSVISAICNEKDFFRHRFAATLIAILTGIVFWVSMIHKMANNIIEINFWSIFAILSLIAWHIALLFNNWEHLFDYEFSFLLLTFVMCSLYPVVFPTFTWETCNEVHCSTEIVFLITTFDSTSTGESVYGNGFIVNKVYDYLSYSGNSSYHYYYQLEDGTPIESNIPVHKTKIEYINADESPYLEIITIRDCSGYNSETGIHALGFTEKKYILYVPAGSIQNALTTDKG